MVNFEEEKQKLLQEQESRKVDYSLTIQRLEILKTLEFVYSKLNAEETKIVDDLIQDEIKKSKTYDDIKYSSINGNGMIDYTTSLDKGYDAIQQAHVRLENYLFNDINKKYTNDGENRG